MHIEHQSAEKRLSVFEEILKLKDLDVLIKHGRDHLEEKKLLRTSYYIFSAMNPAIFEITNS